MKSYKQLSSVERREIYDALIAEYNDYKSKSLSLDLSRGKPNSSQLDISNGLLSVDLNGDYLSGAGFDCRNYGILDGLPEMKALFADVLGLNADDIMVGGNSSLQLMYD